MAFPHIEATDRKFTVRIGQDTNFPPQGELDESAMRMVAQMALLMLQKLFKKQPTLGHAWLEKGWMDECRTMLRDHVDKGDPVDVANLAAMLAWHSQPTNGPTLNKDWTLVAPDGALEWCEGPTPAAAALHHLTRNGGRMEEGWKGVHDVEDLKFTIVDANGQTEHVTADSETEAIRDYFFSLNCEIRTGHVESGDEDDSGEDARFLSAVDEVVPLVVDEPHGVVSPEDQHKVQTWGQDLVERGVGGGETLPGRWFPNPELEVPAVVQQYMQVRKTPEFIMVHRKLSYASSLGFELQDDATWKDLEGNTRQVADLPEPPEDYLNQHVPRTIMASPAMADAPAGKMMVLRTKDELVTAAERPWTVILNYEEPESENEAGYATSVTALTWEQAVDEAITEFMEHDEWGNGEEPEEDPTFRKIKPGDKLRLMDVFPGEMKSRASNVLYVVTKAGAVPEDYFDKLPESDREALTSLDFGDEDE